MKKLVLGLLALVAAPVAAQDAAPDLEMWRLDCGSIMVNDLAPFSDGYLYNGESREFVDSCYLIRNGDRYLLWDAGLPAALQGQSVTQYVFTISVDRTIVEQLSDIGVAPEAIDFVGISHYHDDHIGQASSFPGAALIINQRDYDAVAGGVSESATAALGPWLGDDAGEVVSFPGDHDVFGDGTVTVLAMPGHTPGHSALLVRMPESGTYLLSGDLFHFQEQIANRGVPAFNTNRADTLASMERFLQIDDALDAIIVLQHDPRYLERLPAFPESAR